MKSKMFLYLSVISTLFFVFFDEVTAQESTVTFKSGIIIAIKTETTPSNSTNKGLTDIGTIVSTFSPENIMHRLVTDKKNKLYFGYDISVTPQPERGKFKVLIKPLSINPNIMADVDNLNAQVLPKYPDEILVDDGDTITLEVLENQQTQVKILDLIKVTTKQQQVGNYFIERKPARDFTIDDVELRLTNMEVFVNDEKFGKGGGGVSGANIFIYLPDKGRFIMSPFPRKGFNFQKIGIVENNKISFSFNGDNYKFVSAAPVLGSGGKWNIWILHDADYRSSYNLSPNSYQQGAADKIEFLFKKYQ